MAETDRTLRIGEVATRAGVAVDTVRYYERRGLLPRAPRRRSGYRMFGPDTVERIRLAKRAQALGLRLDEIALVLRAIDAGAGACASARPSLEVALRRVDAEMQALRGLRRRLATTLRDCRAGRCRV
jgi:DNA-binding transcriptional MerR regulator